MRAIRWSVTTLLALSACHSAPPAEVRIAGDPGRIDQLAGQWDGAYRLPAAGRGGSIVFTLVAGENHAHGDVVMVPQNSDVPLRPAPGSVSPFMSDSSRLPQVLTIQFVHVSSGDSVTGSLSPYVDPDCNCSTTATFHGHHDGNRIRGTFTAIQATGRRYEGTWEVRRKS